ncbi:hypothetical protein OKW21_004615 [Catalinimonas alkaloidigena]|uniref:hypothetical protein n=1 Tax=Catalinimonas alkaloidigena TaxID=1075417 RepID=UPI002406C6EF|nr:hypothetical protein [Catalinimonas alkaloidigena]MDF9799352.1 hypothetical protein [Catalinimonas alkaloidigena]
MSNAIDFFEDYCLLPTRAVNNKRPNLEAVQAEMWIWTFFREYYKSQYGDSNTFVITGLSYLTQDYVGNTAFKGVEELSSSVYEGVRKYTEYYLKGVPNSKVFNIILKWLRTDFRNMYSESQKRKLKNLDALKGGLRKPDVLGIRFSNHKIVFELLEVTSADQASSTIIGDLESKKEILENAVKPNIEKEIHDAQIRTGTSIGPAGIDIVYSKWKPNKNQLIIPLLTNVGASKPVKFEWICYKPTLRYNEGKGQDGLILYEIHSVGTPEMVPKRVLEKVAGELRKQMRQYTFELTLTPFLNNYWKSNRAEQQELMLCISAGLGIALVVVLAILLLPEIATASAAAAAYTGAVSATLSAETIAAVGAASAAFPRMITIGEKVIESIKPLPAFAH